MKIFVNLLALTFVYFGPLEAANPPPVASYLVWFYDLNRADFKKIEQSCGLRFRSCIADGVCLFVPREEGKTPPETVDCLKKNVPAVRKALPRRSCKIRPY